MQLIGDVLAAEGRSTDADDVQGLAIAISGLVDGLWLAWGLAPGLFDAARGRRIALEVIAARLAIPGLADN